MTIIRLFLSNLPRRFLVPYRGGWWMWHVVACLVTAVLVLSGFDWWYFEHTRNEYLRIVVMIAGLGGFLVPIVLPVILYIFGRRSQDKHMVRTAVILVQVTAITWILIAVYKMFTGRIQPDFMTTSYAIDISRNFQFGFFRHGVFWGWPSHHTAVAVVSATVIYLSYRNKYLRIIAVAWATIVGFGASVGFHWFSDVVAGAIVGVAVGVTVFRDSERKDTTMY